MLRGRRVNATSHLSSFEEGSLILYLIILMDQIEHRIKRLRPDENSVREVIDILQQYH